MSLRGPTLVMASPPRRGGLPCCLMVPLPWWLRLLAEAGSRVATRSHAHSGSASQLRRSPVSPRGPVLMVASHPNRGELLCHHVAPHPWWLHLPVYVGSRVSTWPCACGASASQSRWALMLPHCPTHMVAPIQLVAEVGSCSPHGAVPMVALPLFRGGLPSHHVAPYPWWLTQACALCMF
jgi:hypothetical protein